MVLSGKGGRKRYPLQEPEQNAPAAEFSVRPSDAFQFVGLPQILKGAKFCFRCFEISPFSVDSAQRVVRLGIGRIELGRLLQLCDRFLKSFFLFEQLSQAQVGYWEVWLDADGVA